MNQFVERAKENSLIVNDTKTEYSLNNEAMWSIKLFPPGSIGYDQACKEWQFILKFFSKLSGEEPSGKRHTAVFHYEPR